MLPLWIAVLIVASDALCWWVGRQDRRWADRRLIEHLQRQLYRQRRPERLVQGERRQLYDQDTPIRFPRPLRDKED